MNSKICSWCFRPFEYRKKWEKNWDDIKLCSDLCRKDSKNKEKKNLKEIYKTELLKQIQQRSPKSICPSEIARSLFENWREHMEPIRQVCRELFLQNKILITQNEKVVKDLNFKGPIRIKKNNLNLTLRSINALPHAKTKKTF